MNVPAGLGGELAFWGFLILSYEAIRTGINSARRSAGRLIARRRGKG